MAALQAIFGWGCSLAECLGISLQCLHRPSLCTLYLSVAPCRQLQAGWRCSSVPPAMTSLRMRRWSAVPVSVSSMAQGCVWRLQMLGRLWCQLVVLAARQKAAAAAMHAGNKSSNNGAATYAFTQAIQRHKGVWGFDIV